MDNRILISPQLITDDLIKDAEKAGYEIVPYNYFTDDSWRIENKLNSC